MEFASISYAQGNRFDEWLSNIPNRDKLTRAQIKEECKRIGLRCNKNNINAIGATGKLNWQTGPAIRLDEINGKLWLSTFAYKRFASGEADIHCAYRTHSLRDYKQVVTRNCSDWEIVEGIHGHNWLFPAKSIDITYCPPSEFIRIINKFM